MQNLMELDYGWSTLSPQFILRIVQIITLDNLINICRPATAILKKLVEADPMSAEGASSSTAPPAPSPGSVNQYGFDVVWEQISKEPKMFETVKQRSFIYLATGPESGRRNPTVIRRAQLGSDAGILGAARLPMLRAQSNF